MPELAAQLRERGVRAELVRCRCEERRLQAIAERLVRQTKANLPHCRAGETPRTFENFQVLEGAEDALAAAKTFRAPKTLATILMLSGVKGCGKSHLLEAIGRKFLADGCSVRYEFVPELFDRLRSSFARGPVETAQESVYAMMEELREVGLLILDDLGLREQSTDWETEKITSVVDYRYRTGAPLVVATNNTSQAEMARKTGDRLADRLFDQSSERVKRVFLSCPSFRTGQ